MERKEKNRYDSRFHSMKGGSDSAVNIDTNTKYKNKILKLLPPTKTQEPL